MVEWQEMKKRFMIKNKLCEFSNGIFSAIQLKKSSEEMVDLINNLEPVTIENTDRNYENGDKTFNVTDYVFVRSLEDLKKLPVEERSMTATAYAIANGISVLNDGTSPYYLRTAHSIHAVNYVSGNGVPYDTYVNNTKKGDWRGIHINLQAIKPGKSTIGFGEINREKRTIEFGCWPKVMVSDSDKLELLLKQGVLVDTGIWYHGALKKNGKLIKNKMYKLNNEYYVRVQQSGENGNGKVLWYQPKMIVWKFLNWDEMPKWINPHGTAKAKFIDAYPEQLLDSGIPFYPKPFDENNSYYQNSTLRGVLNGINVNSIATNGNLNFPAENGGNFSGQGFLQQAFIVPMGLLKNLTKIDEEYKAKNFKIQTMIRRPNENEISLSMKN